MADHQTTGGYPTIGHISSAYFASLAQAAIGDTLEFELITIHAAENIFLLQQQNLQQLQNACNFRLQEYLANE
jgi:antagonist of KipI